jgi:hypothetical protein
LNDHGDWLFATGSEKAPVFKRFVTLAALRDANAPIKLQRPAAAAPIHGRITSRSLK